MDKCAELTVRLVQLLQEDAIKLKPTFGWSVVPQLQTRTWEEAREALSAAPKPVLVAPLLEPGQLAFWSVSALEEVTRERLTREFANQSEYYTEKLQVCKLDGGATLRLQSADSELALSMAEFRAWFRDYSLLAGVTVQTTADPNVGAIVVRPAGGGRAPLGAPTTEP